MPVFFRACYREVFRAFSIDRFFIECLLYRDFSVVCTENPSSIETCIVIGRHGRNFREGPFSLQRLCRA